MSLGRSNRAGLKARRGAIHWVRPATRVGAAILALALIIGFAAGSIPRAKAAASLAGYRDFSYGTGVSGPTTKEAQSKLWFNDGSWWGVLWNPSNTKYQIYRLDTATQTWSSTNLTVDARATVRNDVLWDGTHLYVASAGTNEATATHAPKIRRFSYSTSTKKYSLDQGFPVNVNTGGGMQAFVIDKDSTGVLWGTYTQQSKVWTTHTTGNDQTWVTPYVLPSPGATTIKSEDESSVVAYNGRIGIMWSNQNDGTYYWAVHNDGDPDSAWQITAADQGPAETDNHINLKALNNDPAGQVFAAVKTSLSNPLDAPLYRLLVLGNDGVWRKHTFGRVIDNHTRATVVIDSEDRELYMFAASPCCNGGSVFYKVSNLDNISFPTGLGTPLIQSSTDTHINNVTSTKQTLSSATGLAAIASDDTSRFYLHNQFGLGAGDTAPPNTSIDSGPSGTAYVNSAVFAFSSTEAGSSFACSLDGSAFSSCTSPQTFTSLSDGSHTFQVRATDLSGNVDPTPATRTWTVDTSNQTVLVGSDADAEVDQATPDTNRGTSTTIAVDGSPVSEGFLRFIVGGVTGTVLDARLRLYATDGTLDGPSVYTAGNTWTETGITWNNRPARTSVALDDQASISANTAFEYNVTPAVSGNGTYTFEVAATSDDGVVFNTREAGANKPQLVLTVQGDTTPPETTIDSGPSGTTKSSSASFSFSSSETGSSFACSLDGAAFSTCTSPAAYSGLADGGHSFQVRATDRAGNTDPTPASRNWTIDTVAPAAPQITSPADNSIQSSSTVALAGSAEAGATVALFDGQTAVGSATADLAGSWQRTLTGVGDGAHTYTAVATDAAGNSSPASGAVHVTVDTLAPETTIDSGPSGTTNSSSASFSFSSSETGSSFQCSLDGAAFGSCSSPAAYSNLSEGQHSFQVRATDSAGNTDATPASRSWTIDLTPPTVTTVSPADGASGVDVAASVHAIFSEAVDPTTITTTTFTLVTRDTGLPVSANVSYDAGTFTATLHPVGLLSPGTMYTATVKGGATGASDPAGNHLAADRVWSFAVGAADTTPPETTIDSGPSGTTKSSSASFSFSSSETGSSFACSLDGAAFSTCTSPAAYSGLADGGHSFQVRATDRAGNTDPTPASRNWTIDTVAPAAPQITSPADNSIQSSSTVALAGSAEAGATVALFDGQTAVGSATADLAGSWQRTLTGVGDGAHTYTAVATDAAGNSSPASGAVHVTVDTLAPETTIDSGPSGTTNSSSASFSFSSSETGSSFQCSLDGAAFGSCSSPAAYSNLSEGQHSFQVRATDSAGNTDATPASRSWTISFAIFTDDFELGNFSRWTTVLTGVDGSATVQTSTVKSGTYAAQLSETATTGSFAYARKSLGTARTDLRVSGDLDILQEGASGGNVPFIRLFDPAGTRLLSLYRQNQSGNKVQVGYGGGNFITTGTLALNTWGHLELHVITSGASTSTVEVLLNGTQVYRSTTASLGTSGVLTVQIGNETKAQAFTLAADNITVWVPAGP